MPIYSMTGFARTQVRVHDQLVYTLSIKSVNHRFLDIQLRLPVGFDALEMELRRVLKENLVRGHVELTLSVDRTMQQKSGYNREMIAGYLDAFKQARSEFHLKGEPDLNVALRIPGALQAEARNNTEDDVAALTESALREVIPLLDQLKVMRAREGESVAASLHAYLDRLAEGVVGVSALRPEVEQRYQERLTQRLIAATGNEFNRQRLLEEVAVLVDHSDISEELERMTTHIGHFRELLNSNGEVGKKLDFLLQEMNREANTLLSKMGGVGGKGTRITELGLGMKADIEKAREQVQNAE
ncbi:MAG TPA: YicC/YloC family endoribonuclease [Terracidiphilus sp.]|nr:YicC/YloC family endoribonuclease [Terracidiphilus sp.]